MQRWQWDGRTCEAQQRQRWSASGLSNTYAARPQFAVLFCNNTMCFAKQVGVVTVRSALKPRKSDQLRNACAGHT